MFDYPPKLHYDWNDGSGASHPIRVIIPREIIVGDGEIEADVIIEEVDENLYCIILKCRLNSQVRECK